MKTSILFASFLILTFVKISGQVVDSTYLDLPDKAFKLFQNEEYNEALTIYDLLISEYPRDPEYNYFTGIALVKAHQKIEKAIRHLRFASMRYVPKDVYFYLGRAYHLNQDFDKALTAYELFDKYGERSQKKELHLDRLMKQARNGKKIIQNRPTQAEIIMSFKLHKDELINYLNSQLLSSNNFQLTPNQIYNDYDILVDSNLINYIPVDLKKGEKIFLPGTLRNKRANLDIFSLTKKDLLNFQHIEELDFAVNSMEDECFAYFDQKTGKMLFASQGHSSIGGFDLFISEYNKQKNSWSNPLNPGIIINSPYNEVFGLISGDTILVVNDHTSSKDTLKLTFYSTALKFSSLAWEPDFNHINDSEKKIEDSSLSKKQPENKEDILQENQEVKNRIPDNYDAWITFALDFQYKSDSLNQKIVDYRKELESIDDQNDKNKFYTKISQAQKQSEQYELQADALFTKAREWESKNLKNESYNIVEKGEKEIKELKRESNKKTDKSVEKNKKDNKPENLKFEIHKTSYYTENQPIPIAEVDDYDLLYQVQLGVYSTPVENDFFRGLYPVNGISLEGRGLWKYFAGQFNKYEEAYDALQLIRDYGYADAFIISRFRGKLISINRAQEIEKELNKK